MTYALQAVTEQGRRLVALAEELSTSFAERAAQHDHEGTFPVEHLNALRDTGYLYAPIPAEYGGLGVESVHDVLVASSRLARHDPSLVLGVNMHLISMQGLARQWRMAQNAGNTRRATAVAASMERMVSQEEVVAAAVSEPDQDLTRPAATATRVEGGWALNGRKIICSMAPAATLFAVSFRFTAGDGSERYAFVAVPRDTPGVTVHDDWDALGMRASASCSVSFTNSPIPDRAVGRGFPAGELSVEFLERFITAGPAHASPSVGIAEQAHRLAVLAVQKRQGRAGARPERATVRHLAAENAVDLAALRGVFSRALRVIDEYEAAHPVDSGSLAEARALFSEVQSAKAFINQASVRIVDRAMTITGGAAYLNTSPLARLYRDVRAGAFMHPLGANLAYEFIGAEALGLAPPSI